MFPLQFDGARRGFIKVDGVRVGPWEEVVGIMDSVETHEERVVLRISSIRQITVDIPLNELMTDGVKLEQLKGRKIAILRTDEQYILKQSKLDEDTRSKVS